MDYKNDTFLADWIANKISDEQLKLLVSNEDFLVYQNIKKSLQNFSVVEPDMNANYEKIQLKITAKKNNRKPKVIALWKFSAVAASFLLFFACYQTFYFSNEVKTDFGVTQIITLKDESKVTLNAKSQLFYPNQFNWNRTLKLEGEAFFEVKKGSAFTVKTPQGSITVLGTKFNVNAEKDFFEVICYEGKVSVLVNNEKTILTKNKSIRFYQNKFEFNNDNLSLSPSWINKESSFKNVPLKIVIDKFATQFNKKIVCPENKKEIKFTGSFPNQNIEIALKSITIPLHLKYSINENQIILRE